jgi:hypothetical protein
VPISLGPGANSGDIELFDVTVSNPLLDAAGTYLGSYDLLGGADGNAQNLLLDSPATFSVTTTPSVTATPEPESVVLLATVLALTGWLFADGREKQWFQYTVRSRWGKPSGSDLSH